MMAGLNIDEKQVEALMKAYRERQELDRWNNHQDYDRRFMQHMQEEIEEHWKFMTWLKYTYPQALGEYKAVKDVERSANGI